MKNIFFFLQLSFNMSTECTIYHPRFKKKSQQFQIPQHRLKSARMQNVLNSLKMLTEWTIYCPYFQNFREQILTPYINPRYTKF